MKFGNADGAKAPCSEVNVQSRKSPVIDENLITPLDSVRTLQNALQAKAKSEATFRFTVFGTRSAEKMCYTKPTGAVAQTAVHRGWTESASRRSSLRAVDLGCED